MLAEPNAPSSKDDSYAGTAPPLLPSAQPPVIDAPRPPLKPVSTSSSARQFLTFLLSLCLGLFLADALISLADDTLILLFGAHLLAGIRGIVFLFALVVGAVVFGLMALTPLIPKRLFLPLTLFNPLAALLVLPLLVYFHARMQQVAWIISLCQVILGLGFLFLIQGGLKLHWPLVPLSRLAGRGFSWLNLCAFLAVNVFVVVPAVLVYLVFCTGLALDHFTDGFVALRRDGLVVQVRKYVRSDGKTVQLFPMSHVADPAFYQKVAHAFPSNSVILMEGVTDDRNLLTNKISYERMAKTLGVAEQHQEFTPIQGEWVAADMDVEHFSTNTIALLNMVMLIHSKGLTPENLLTLLQYHPPPNYEAELWDDLLTKRNQHVVAEMKSRLASSDYIIMPWGAAHMAGIAGEIQKSGFRLEKTEEYLAIRFRFFGNKRAGKDADHETPK